MKKYGVLFAGQGAQYLKMGEDFYKSYDYLHKFYDEASSVLGYDLKEVCFEKADLLNQTLYTQPAILVTSSLIYQALVRECNIKPTVMAGFSLGEYSALLASSILNFTDAVKLINKRSQFMNEAAINNPGSMAAVMGATRSDLLEYCLEIKDLYIANYNSPNQIVMSGSNAAIDLLIQSLKAVGKRAIKLNVSGAFHSSFMHEASLKLEDELKNYQFQKPSCPVIANYNAQELDVNNIIETLRLQIESSVYFEDSIRLMIDKYQIDEFIEIGPGKVLSGFLKKINPEIPVTSIDKLEDVINFKREITN